MATPRGIANNNPGNIVKTATVWRGEKTVSSDPNFEQFETIELGYRALIKLLTGKAYFGLPSDQYYTRVYEPVKGTKVYGPLNTIDKILSKYCDDQTTADYIKTVEKQMGKGRFEVIDPNDRATLKRLVMAISYVENGVKAVESQVDAAFALLDDEKKSSIEPAVIVEDLTSAISGSNPLMVFVAIGLFLFLMFNSND